jgi:hypothetical protein
MTIAMPSSGPQSCAPLFTGRVMIVSSSERVLIEELTFIPPQAVTQHRLQFPMQGVGL